MSSEWDVDMDIDMDVDMDMDMGNLSCYDMRN